MYVTCDMYVTSTSTLYTLHTTQLHSYIYIYIIVIIDMSVLPSRWTNCFRSELARNRSSPARLRGGWGLAGAGAGVPQRSRNDGYVRVGAKSFDSILESNRIESNRIESNLPTTLSVRGLGRLLRDR